MAGDSGSGAADYKIRANFEWPPERYYLLGVYTALFNAISNDAEKFRGLGIDYSSGDQHIDKIIFDNIDKLVKPEDPETNPFGVFKDGIHVDVAEFKKDFKNLVAENKALSKVKHSDSEGHLTGRLTNEEMTIVLRKKSDEVREHYNDNRKNAKAKSGQNPKKDSGKPGESGIGTHAQDYQQAYLDLQDKKYEVRMSRLKFWGEVLGSGAGVGGVVLGITSIFTGMWIPGIITALGGGFLTKFFGDKAIEESGALKVFKRDLRRFKQSKGKYKSKDKKALGFKDIEQRFWEDKAIEHYYRSGGQNGILPKYKYRYEPLKKMVPELDEHGNPVFDEHGKPKMKPVEVTDDKGRVIYNKVRVGKVEYYSEMNKAWKRAQRRGARAYLDIDKDVKYYDMVNSEDGKYFVLDKASGTYRKGYGFKYLEGMLTSAKSMNVNDTLSVQGHTSVANDELKGPPMTLPALKTSIQRLNDASSKFTGDNQLAYRRLLTGYTQKAVESFENYLFDTVFSSDTVSEARDIMNDKVINDRLKDADAGQSVDAVENMIAFAKLESNDSAVFTTGQYKKITAGKGASLADQITMSDESMRHTITSKMGIAEDSDEFTVANEYIRRITTVSDMTQANKVLIDVSGDTRLTPKAREYLSFMASKKKSTTTYTEADFAGMTDENKIGETTIEKAIAELTDTSKADVIRQQISGMSDPDKQELAYKYLNEQIESIEIRRRADASKRAMAKIRVNAYQDFDDRVQEIEKIIAESTTDAKELAKIESNISLQVTDEDLKEYLMLKFKDAVHTAFLKEGKDEKYTQAQPDGSTVKEIMKYMQKVQGNKYLDDWQKNSITSQMESNLENAMDAYLQQVKAQYIDNYDKGSIKVYRTQGYLGGGLMNYFDLKTAASERIKNKLNNIWNDNVIYDTITLSGSRSIVDNYTEDEKEIVNSAVMGTDSSPRSTHLVDFIKKLKTGLAYTGEQLNAGIDGIHTNIKKLFTDPDFTALVGKEKTAALLVFRNRCLALFREHIHTYASTKGGMHNFTTNFYTGSTYSDYMTNVYTKWEKLFNAIDVLVPTEFVVEKGAQLIQAASKSNTLVGFAQVGENGRPKVATTSSGRELT